MCWAVFWSSCISLPKTKERKMKFFWRFEQQSPLTQKPLFFSNLQFLIVCFLCVAWLSTVPFVCLRVWVRTVLLHIAEASELSLHCIPFIWQWSVNSLCFSLKNNAMKDETFRRVGVQKSHIHKLQSLCVYCVNGSVSVWLWLANAQ